MQTRILNKTLKNLLIMRNVVFVLLLAINLSAYAQDWAKLPEQSKKVPSETKLNVGDKVPFSELKNMVNYAKPTYIFSERKAKLTILDFWDTSCGPCIKFWPTAMKLQQEFGPDLQILPVNKYQGSAHVKKFLERRKRIDGFEMNLPMSCRDSTLWKNFPTSIFPLYVWIDANGVIGAITETKDVTRENIKKWLTGGPFKMNNIEQKKFFSPLANMPIFVNGNGGERSSDVFVLSSSITKGQDDMPSFPIIHYDSMSGYGITITNSAIVYLYGTAYNNRLREFDYLDFLPISRMQLLCKDSTKYYDDGTLGGNTYSYQFISGKSKTRSQLFEIMQQDLQRYFGLEVKWEKQLKKCLVLTMFDSTLATKTKGLATELMMRDGKINLDSVTVKDITTVMEMGTFYYRDRKYPLVDETNYKGVVTGIRESSKLVDPVTLDRILSKHGMHIRFDMREVDILVLKEPESN
jgi:thiol-disulfide isomerase/thioredoxin